MLGSGRMARQQAFGRKGSEGLVPAGRGAAVEAFDAAPWKWWQVALLAVALMLAAQVAGWYVIRVSSGVIGQELAAPFGLQAYAISRSITSGFKFVVLATTLWAVIRLMGAKPSFLSSVSALLMLLVANLVGKLLEAAALHLTMFTSEASAARDTPFLEALGAGVAWLNNTPYPMTVVLIAVAALAARIAGRIEWPQALVAGLAVALASFVLEYLFFSMMLGAESALLVALSQILRLA